MPYKDPDKQKAAQTLSWRRRKWASRTADKMLEVQRKWRRKTGQASKCLFSTCENFRNSHRYCDTHNLKNMIGDHKLYDRVRNQLRKSVGRAKILDVPQEIFLVMLVVNNAKHELLKMKRERYEHSND